MTATNHDDQRHNLIKFDDFLKYAVSTPLVSHVFIAVAVMVYLVVVMVVAVVVCGRHGMV